MPEGMRETVLLKFKLAVVDAAGYIKREDQDEVDFVRRAHALWRHEQEQKRCECDAGPGVAIARVWA